MTNYSQNREQDYIVNYFGNEIGKFVDIGAYDVFRLSNTRALIERGWSGVLVEPAPSNYQRIAEYYKDADNIKTICAAIGAESGLLEFYESDGDAVSTSNKEHRDKWAAAGVEYRTIHVIQIPVDKFMEAHGDCDFLSIDTESTNMDIFRLMPSRVWDRIKMLCIEHDGSYLEIKDKLAPFGFKEIYFNAENIILAK